MKTKSEVLEAAELLNLQTIETCDNGRSYPSGLNEAVIGFENIEAAKDFATENNCEVCLFKIRAGHHFYQNLGWTNDGLTYRDYLDNLGDNYREFDLHEEFKAIIDNLSNSFDVTIDDYAYVIDLFRNYEQEVNDLSDDKVLIYNGHILESFPKQTMSYREDVYTYVVGVAVDNE